jgi:hypothetical protein
VSALGAVAHEEGACGSDDDHAGEGREDEEDGDERGDAGEDLHGSASAAAAQISELFVGWLRDREVVVTRLELTLEAARDDELAAVFTQWRERLLDVVEEVVARTREADARPHAEAVVAALEGVLLAALARPARGRRAFVSRTVDTVLTAFAAGPR